MELSPSRPSTGMRWRVLVTRPEPGASATARRLRAEGVEPVVLPLTTISSLPVAPLPSVPFDAVAVTSAQALRSADPALIEPLRDMPLFAVGERTGAAARAAGFRSVAEAGAGAAAMARLVLAWRPAVTNLLYLCGRVRRPDFEASLRAGGVWLHAFETYDTQDASPTPEVVAQALGNRRVAAVLLYSVLGAQAFARLLGDPVLADRVSDAVPLALSPRILGALPPGVTGFAAEQPNEAALFALLAELRAGAAPFQPSRV